MVCGIENCTMLIMKSEERHMTDGMELPNQAKTITLGKKESYKYLEIVEADNIKQVEMKGKVKKEYLMRTRKLPETKLNSGNRIKGLNTWDISVVRYSRPFFK